MKKILEALGIMVVGVLGCGVYLVLAFLGAVITIIVIG